VDDDLAIRELLVEYLATRGYRVDATADGRLALELMRSGRFDLILTDYQIPHLNGLDLVRVARRLDPPIPCILMTGFASVESAVNALKEGASDYLLKPFRLKRIHEAIQAALEQARQHKADAKLASLVALYDFAATVRTRWHLRLLAQQIPERLKEAVPGILAAIALLDEESGQWRWSTWCCSTELEPSALLASLDLERIVATIAPDATAICDEAQSYLSAEAGPDELVSWLATRPITLDEPGAPPRIMGALVLAGAPSDGAPSDELLQPMTRFALLLGNAASRVRLLEDLDEKIAGEDPPLSPTPRPV